MWYMNEDREMLQKAFREYAQKRVRPLALKMEDEDASSRDALLEMGRLGMFTMPMAPEDARPPSSSEICSRSILQMTISPPTMPPSCRGLWAGSL